MILLLDLGNSLVKWGLRASGAWVAQGALAHAGLEAGLAGLLAAHPVKACHGVNVAGAAAAARVQAQLARQGLAPVWLRSQAEACGVRNGYLQPERLGADRWAALIAARGRCSGAVLVVCAGTATTVDALDRSGNFRGGLILPGERLMRQALAGNTAQLPLAEGVFQPFPRSTDDAIVSGCRQAQVGAVERMYALLAAEGPVDCLLSGGAADSLQPLLGMPLQRVDNLVLEGLARALELQQGGAAR